MNPFEKHKLPPHLSASQLNKFIEMPGLWAWEYPMGHRLEGNAKMWRGSAVEGGFVALLRGAEWNDALEHAHSLFWVNFSSESPEAISQGKLIEPMLKQCSGWPPPSDLLAAQVKIEHWFEGVPVPITGWLDMSFEGIDVDLKTTEKMFSNVRPRPDHVRQVSLYRAARGGKPGGVLYVTAGRHLYFDVTDEMMEESLKDFADAARKITKLLELCKDPEEIMSILPIDYAHWKAPKRASADARKAASASDDFEAVELETRA
jgi:hypothetical protein